MASINDMQNTLDKLRVGDSIPGLSSESIIDNSVEVEFKDALDTCESDDKRKAMKDKFVAFYADGPGKKFIDENISQIKYLYKQVKDSINALKNSATQITASNLVPSVITVGTATSTPNPAYTAIDNSQKKQNLLAVLKSVTDFLIQLFSYALLLDFVLPDSVQALVSTLATLTAIINAIPG